MHHPSTPEDPARPRLEIRQGAYLPHWTKDGSTYFITFRLGDSLPASVLESWRVERQHILARAEQMGRPLTWVEEDCLRELFSERIEAWLDRGQGESWLADPRVGELVSGAIRHFDGERYRLDAWCVMPNHVHAVLAPVATETLSDILHSWKSFTSKQANKLLARSGTFWQPEYFDHLVRSTDEHYRLVAYTLDNPRAAGLTNWPWVGVSEHWQKRIASRQEAAARAQCREPRTVE